MPYASRVHPARGVILDAAGKRRAAGVESLEARTLLSATLAANPPAVRVATSAGPSTINLNTYFTDTAVTGTLVIMQTTQGTIPINLFDSQVLATVTNFTNYVRSGEYDGTFFHRVIQQGIQIVQGGTYTTSLNPITTGNPIALQAAIPNTAGTIAMARTSDPNSATSGFFFNVGDNSSQFTGNNQYAVFGQVIYGGMTAVNAIYNLPQASLTTNDNQPQTNVPVVNYTSGTPSAANLVALQNAYVSNPLTFGASTDNNQLVVPTIASDGTLTLTYTPGATGTAHIDVSASDLAHGVATASFTVTVGGPPTTDATIGKGSARIVRFTDPNGIPGTATLTGPGTATLTFTGDGVTTSTSKAGVETVTGTPQSISIATTGTSTASVLHINGAVALAGITADADLGSVTGPGATLTGNSSFAGSIGAITIAAANSGAISVSGTGRPLNLRVGSASGESLSADGTIASLNARSWTTGGGIVAAGIDRVAVRGEFNAGINVAALGPVAAGSITTSAWNVTGNAAGISAGSITGLSLSAGVIGPITDRGAAQNDTIHSAGDFASFAALGMSGTRLQAGAGSVDPSGLATAFSTNATIGNVRVGRGGFSNSVIDGQTLRRVSLGAVNSANGGTPFGVAAADIVLLTATIDGKRLNLARATAASDVTAALTKAGITTGDLVIRIVS